MLQAADCACQPEKGLIEGLVVLQRQRERKKTPASVGFIFVVIKPETLLR